MKRITYQEGVTLPISEVREIVLAFENLALYSNSHKLTRSQLRSELETLYEKYDLDRDMIIEDVSW